jgi:hypothetical protein
MNTENLRRGRLVALIGGQSLNDQALFMGQQEFLERSRADNPTPRFGP